MDNFMRFFAYHSWPQFKYHCWWTFSEANYEVFKFTTRKPSAGRKARWHLLTTTNKCKIVTRKPHISITPLAIRVHCTRSFNSKKKRPCKTYEEVKAICMVKVKKTSKKQSADNVRSAAKRRATKFPLKSDQYFKYQKEITKDRQEKSTKLRSQNEPCNSAKQVRSCGTTRKNR